MCRAKRGVKDALSFLLIAPAFLLAACSQAPKPLPSLPIPKAIPVAPSVSAVRPAVERANEKAVEIRDSQALLEKQAADLAEKARLLETSGTAQASDLARLAVEHAVETTAQAARIDALKADLAEAREKLATAQDTAAASDTAASMLHAQAESLNGQYQNLAAELRTATTNQAVTAAELHRVAGVLLWLQLACAGYVALRLAKLTVWGKAILFWLP